MNDAKRVKLCFPEPPTPTRRAFPRGVRIIRDTLEGIKKVSKEFWMFFYAHMHTDVRILRIKVGLGWLGLTRIATLKTLKTVSYVFEMVKIN